MAHDLFDAWMGRQGPRQMSVPEAVQLPAGALHGPRHMQGDPVHISGLVHDKSPAFNLRDPRFDNSPHNRDQQLSPKNNLGHPLIVNSPTHSLREQLGTLLTVEREASYATVPNNPVVGGGDANMGVSGLPHTGLTAIREQSPPRDPPWWIASVSGAVQPLDPRRWVVDRPNPLSYLSVGGSKVPCACNCGRSGNTTFPYCCVLCRDSQGVRHGPLCEFANRDQSRGLVGASRIRDNIRPVWQQHPWAIVATALSIVILMILILIGSRHNHVVLPPLPGNPVQPGTVIPFAKPWLVCAGAGQCGHPTLQRWTVSPPSLAAAITDFSTVPGIPDNIWKPVAEHWSASPPSFRGAYVQLSDIAWFASELLRSDPFQTVDEVPYVDFRPPGDQKVVIITQRQLAFLVANALMGNTIASGDGLAALLRRCSAKSVRRTFVYSLLSFLAILSQELKAGEQGTTLVAATPRGLDETAWRKFLGAHTLTAPKLCVRQGGTTDCGVADFMSGGTPFQALTDIAGGVVGGGAELCDIADSQDESLVQFYSEVLALSFFAGPGNGVEMLPVPFTLLGARRYLNDLSGESSIGATCGTLREKDWLNEEIQTQTVMVALNGEQKKVAASAFVAVASACSGCIAGDTCSLEDNVNNLCDTQRRHVDQDISLWYQAYEATMYNEMVQPAFRSLIQRIGSGPWGAGVWWGDSQQYFLTIWLATSLLAGGDRLLDYYMYDHFCENPGNQCFVLGGQGCTKCIGDSQANTGIKASRCGLKSVHDMVTKFGGQPAETLYAALLSVQSPPTQVFDLLGDSLG